MWPLPLPIDVRKIASPALRQNCAAIGPLIKRKPTSDFGPGGFEA
jgi:hypothetical protein